jgi:two-component system LytT family sensor kinase
MILLALFERAALMLMVLFFLGRTRLFKNVLWKGKLSGLELAFLSALFSGFAVGGTYMGIPVEGALVNVRTIAIMSGGILFGPWVGIPAGIISGLHRFLIDIHGPSAIACLISSICAGLLSTAIHYHGRRRWLWLIGSLAGMACECLTMLLILLFAPAGVGIAIVSEIAWPMIIGSMCTGMIIKRIQDIEDEKELTAANEARLALIIANRTLPFFQNVQDDTLAKVCEVIHECLEADAVAITDRDHVLAYVGIGHEYYDEEHKHLSDLTADAIRNDRITVDNNLHRYPAADFRSVAIVPLRENGLVTGTLKIFFTQPDMITDSLRELGVGLSQLISTQIELSRVKALREMAAKAEFRALQSKINPHFLFNALNAISSLVRLRPDEARQVIAKLADYLRQNLSLSDGMIDIQDELRQVRDYVAIEQARFGPKLTVTFDVDNVNIDIPSLSLQPLVENAILHGIQSQPRPGEVHIAVKRLGDSVSVTIRDTGKGIDPEVIKAVENGEAVRDRIGLMNVNERLKLLHGHGLNIQRLEPGTSVSFDLPLENRETA